MIGGLLLTGGAAWLAYRYFRDRTGLRPGIRDTSERGGPRGDGPPLVESAGSPPAEANPPDAPDEAAVRRGLAVSCSSLVMVSAGHLTRSSLLTMGGVPLVVLAGAGFVHESWRMWREERRPVAIMDGVVITMALVTGQFATTALLATLAYGSRLLLNATEDRSRESTRLLFAELPRTVWLRRDGQEIEVPLSAVEIGEAILVEAGQVVPFDGSITQGRGRLDERALTGESMPVEKTVGDPVFATTIVLEGRVLLTADRSGGDCIAADVTATLSQASDYRERVRQRGERLIDEGVAPTAAAGVTTLVLRGSNAALAVLFCSFGYILRYVGPIAVLNYLRVASQNGVLVKDGRALEVLGAIDTVVLDKTGTLTEDQLQILRVEPLCELDEPTLFALVAGLEARQTHPIARTLVAGATERGVPVEPLEGVAVELGLGLRALVDGVDVAIGSRTYMVDRGIDVTSVVGLEDEVDAGVTRIYVGRGDDLVGWIELGPRIRPEAVSVVEALHARGLEVVILSGDREGPTRRLAAEVGADAYHAEVLPDEKARVIEAMQQAGRRVCFIGDGINDAIALKQADVSISLSGATAVARDTAAVVLMSGTLEQVDWLFGLAGRMRDNLDVSVALSTAPSALCVAGVYVFGFGFGHAILIYQFSLIAGLVNAMRPVLAERAASPDAQGEDGRR